MPGLIKPSVVAQISFPLLASLMQSYSYQIHSTPAPAAESSRRRIVQIRPGLLGQRARGGERDSETESDRERERDRSL